MTFLSTKHPIIPTRWPLKRSTVHLDTVYVAYSMSSSTQKHMCGEAAYCLNVLKVTALLLGVEWLVVEQPEEGHVQRGVMSDFTTEHHTLSHRHLHPDGGQLHPHGLWNINIIPSSADKDHMTSKNICSNVRNSYQALHTTTFNNFEVKKEGNLSSSISHIPWQTEIHQHLVS